MPDLKGVRITYKAVLPRTGEESEREVYFASMQHACNWLSDNWPIYRSNMQAHITNIETNINPNFCTPEITMTDSATKD